jgi:putative membrane protein
MTEDPRFPRPEFPEASRRTYLANERTELAWWRTGLTALAVSLGVGRLIPELGGHGPNWPYVVIGAGYAVLGTGFIVYGSWRERAVRQALQRGEFAYPDSRVFAALTALAVLLGIATFLLVVIES